MEPKAGVARTMIVAIAIIRVTPKPVDVNRQKHEIYWLEAEGKGALFRVIWFDIG